MRLQSLLTTALTAFTLTTLAGCGSLSTNTTTTTPAANNSNATASNTSRSESPSTTDTDISGNYDTTGTNPDGGTPYKADLTVTKRDQVYQFSWKSGDTNYDGVGVTTGNSAAVAYTTGKNGEGCGVVLYKINPDGSMTGKVGYWGENRMETEQATRKSGSDLEGEYDISGKNPDGQEYKGTLKVKKEGQGYQFMWSAPDTLEGFGIRGGDMVAVGFGDKQCAFVGYDIKPDGTLDGKWGAKTSKTLGTEVAKKK